MILIDDRIGSRELLDGLRNLGCDATIAGHLDADFQWTGNGPDGAVLVGVERKDISDFLTSMRDRRLGGKQAIDMGNSYDVQYLIVEGAWRCGAAGVLEVPAGRGEWRAARGSYKFAEAVSFMCSLEELWGMRLWRCYTQTDTCAVLVARHNWWRKEWKDHKSDKQIYCPEPNSIQGGHRARIFRRKPSLLERWVYCLPGIEDRAMEIAKYFSSAHDMANATKERWLDIKGLRLGKKTAENIVEAINS